MKFGGEVYNKIWSSTDNLILIYVGSAADFALNPENHWLFYTGNLPNDPQKRFIRTLAFHQMLIHTDAEKVPEIASRIRNIHSKIEEKRSQEEGASQTISNQAFLEVSDMILDYAIRGYEYLNHRQLTPAEKQQFYSDMHYINEQMGVSGQPESYSEWEQVRMLDIESRLAKNEFTDKLYAAYKKDMGFFKYQLLINFQSWFVNSRVAEKLKLKRRSWFFPIYKLYPIIRNPVLLRILLWLILKPDTVKAIYGLNR